MKLGTLGAILKFAIELESRSLKLYQQTVDISTDKTVLDYQKRIKKLKRLRRENTTEMILEPIDDFESTTFEINEGDTVKSSINKIAEFYEVASQKTEFVIEVSLVLQQFGKKFTQMLA